MCNKFWCNVFGKGTQPFDFIKCKEIPKLVDEVKYIIQAINNVATQYKD